MLNLYKYVYANLRLALLARPNTSCTQTNRKPAREIRNHVSTRSGEEGTRTQPGSTCSTRPRGPTAKTSCLRVSLLSVAVLTNAAPFQIGEGDKHLCPSWPPFLQVIKFSFLQNRSTLCPMLSGVAVYFDFRGRFSNFSTLWRNKILNLGAALPFRFFHDPHLIWGHGPVKVWLSALPFIKPFPHFSVCPSSVLSDASFTSAAGAAVAAATATSKSVRRNLTQENQGGIPQHFILFQIILL